MQRFWLPCAFVLFAGVLPAQTIYDQNANAWLMYFGDHPVSKHWGVHLEGQWRRTAVFNRWQQLVLRPAVNYDFNRNWIATFGYCYVRSYPYGAYPAANRVPEHRIYEQLQAKYKTGPVGWLHRFRLEQRRVGIVRDGEVRDWQPRNRFRYMLRSDLPLPVPRSWHRERFLLGLYDEVFFGFGVNRGPHVVDQNRAYAAVGYRFRPDLRVEVGYLHQYLPHRSGNVFEENHTLQVALYSSIPFRRSGKGR